MPPTVLLVDDDPSIRTVATINLQASGIDVIETENGEAALAAVRNGGIDLVLLDVMMPGMSGWDVALELRRDERLAVPVAFVSAKTATADRIRGYELGAIDYITKPFNPVELADRVRELIASAKTGDAQRRARDRLERLLANDLP